jgi:hypothetical protein
MESLWIISVDFDITDQLVIRCFCICQILEKKWEYNGTVHQLFLDFEKVCDSLRTELLYNVYIELGILMKKVRLIKTCLIKPIENFS